MRCTVLVLGVALAGCGAANPPVGETVGETLDLTAAAERTASDAETPTQKATGGEASGTEFVDPKPTTQWREPSVSELYEVIEGSWTTFEAVDGNGNSLGENDPLILLDPATDGWMSSASCEPTDDATIHTCTLTITEPESDEEGKDDSGFTAAYRLPVQLYDNGQFVPAKPVITILMAG